jgi:hypothetical protein
MSAVHYFTPDEVNAILPRLQPVLGELLERRARTARLQQGLEDVVQNGLSDVGNAAASGLVHEFAAIEALLQKLLAFGCDIKDFNGGLIDFLSRRHGRPVYLCWRYGEPPVIRYYHELNAGFQGRKLIDFDVI